MQEEFVALQRIAEGAVDERFSEAFQEVIENICDQNTDATAKRSITIELRLKPTEHRNWADYELLVKTKLAPELPVVGSFRIGRLGGRIEATEIRQEQQDLLPTSTPAAIK